MNRRSEVRGRISEYNPTGAQNNQQRGGMNGGWFILSPYLSALNHFLDSEYQLLQYDYISDFTVRYLYL